MSRTEAETRADLIDPALKEVGWGEVEGSHIRRGPTPPLPITSSTTKARSLPSSKAKKEALPPTEGVRQAKVDATKLQTPFAFSTNGLKIYQIDMVTGAEGETHSG